MMRETEKILIVEDAPDFQLMVKASLEPKYRTEVVSTVAEARKQLETASFDLVVLDLGLPDGEGGKLCAELRADQRTRALPVIVLTGRAQLEDKLRAFALGADDYVVKPFESLELRARVEAKLARARDLQRSPWDSGIWAGEGIQVDLAAQRAYLKGPEGKRTDAGLTPIEFKILVHLVRNEGKVVSREELLAHVWGKETHVFGRATDKHVSSLRQKLGESARRIQTVSGVGYRFS